MKHNCEENVVGLCPPACAFDAYLSLLSLHGAATFLPLVFLEATSVGLFCQ